MSKKDRMQGTSIEIDEEVHGRFDQRNNIFGRLLNDPEFFLYRTSMFELSREISSQDIEGYTDIDFARVQGAWAVYNHFHQAFSWDGMTEANTVMEDAPVHRYEIEDEKEMSELVKETGKIYGASKVGITKIDERWIYTHEREGNRISIPEDYENAIVLLIEMDRDIIDKSPSMTTGVENALTYSKMAFVIGCMAKFVRELGYKAIPMGNDTALSIPLAVKAGLGKLGRNGLLITPELGPSVKICKVFTDMPLVPDVSRGYNLLDACSDCKKCADACEVDAIQFEKEPSFKTFSKSNNKGLKRWAVDVERCYRFWVENGGDCSTCISACPFINGKSF
ncbi:MAG: reductive dehalogenase domain-containing protein [Thermoplasmata archaeon]